MQRLIKDRDFSQELTFTFLRSQGPGGQHVNKVNTQVLLSFSVTDSQLLTDEEKTSILKRLGARLTSKGVLQIRCQEHRSQLANKRTAIKKFEELLFEATRKQKKRIPTKVSKAVKEKRLAAKRRKREIKAGRAKLNPRQFL